MREKAEYLEHYYKKLAEMLRSRGYSSLSAYFLLAIMISTALLISLALQGSILTAPAFVVIALFSVAIMAAALTLHFAYQAYSKSKLPCDVYEKYLWLEALPEQQQANNETKNFLRGISKLAIGIVAIAAVVVALSALLTFSHLVVIPAALEIALCIFGLPCTLIVACSAFFANEALKESVKPIFTAPCIMDGRSVAECDGLPERVFAARADRRRQENAELQRQIADMRPRRRRASSASTLFGDEKVEMNPPDNDLDSEETLLAGVVSARRVSI